jgi:HSP20 family protein
MLTLWNQFDDLFGSDDLWKGMARPGERKFLPAVDIRETKEGYVLTADVPGVPAEAIDISVKDGVLTIQGARTTESRAADVGYQRVERAVGKFQRSFVLPKGVNSEGIHANVEHGVLTLSIPKPVAALPHKVEIKVGSGKPSESALDQKAG